MADVVDSIIAELIVKNEAYVRGFNEATAAHDKFLASTNKLKTNTFDLQAEGQKYKAGADAISGAEEQLTQKVTRTRKARVDAVKQSGNAEVQAEIATQQRITKAVDDGIAARSAAVRRGSGRNIGATVSGRADNARQGLNTGVPGATVEVAAEKEVNAALVEQVRLQAGMVSARGADRTLIREQIADMRTYNGLIRAGLTEEAAAVELDRIRVARAKELAVQQASANRSGVGRNAFRFAEGAGIGRTGGGGAALGGIAAAGIAAGIYELSKAGLEYAQTLKQDSDQLGLTTRDLQLYQRAAQQAGVTTEQTKEALGQLGQNLGRAQEGAAEQSRIFDRLHIDVGNAQTGFKSLSDILPTLRDRLSQIPDKTQRLAIEAALGGDQLRKLDPILSQNEASFDSWAASVEKAGGILSNSDIQKSDQTAKRIKALNDELQRDLASTVSQNAASIETLAKSFLSLADGALKAFGYLRQIDNLDVINGGLNSRLRQGLSGTSQSSDRQRAFKELLETPQGRQALLARNSSTLSALSIADKGNGLDFTAPDLGNVADNPKARYAAYQQAIQQRAQIMRVQKAYADAAASPSAPVQPGKPGTGILAPPPAKGPKGKSAESLENERIARDKRYADELDQLQQDALRAQEDLTGDIQKRADIENQLAQKALDRRIADINSERDRNVNKGEDAGEAESRAKILRDAATEADAQSRKARDQEKLADLANAELQHQQTTLSIRQDGLNADLSLARTTKDRLAIELKLLENAKEQERNQLQQQLNSLKPGDPGRDDVQARINALDAKYAGQAAATREQNLTPGQQYVRSLETTPDTIQQKEVDVLNQFNDGLDKSVSKALHLHGIFGDIVNDLIDMVVKQALIKPLAGALFGGDAGASGGGAGGLFGSLLGGIGKIFGGGGGGWSSAVGASIGGAQPTSMAVSAITGLPAFANGGSLSVLGNGGVDRNVMSINGQPVARINHGETINVVPTNQRVNGSPAPVIMVSQPITADFSGARTDEQTMREFQTYADAKSRQAAETAISVSGRQAPGVVRSAQTLKG